MAMQMLNQSTVLDNPSAVNDLYNEARALWLWLHAERLVPWTTAALALVDLDKRYTNPTLTNRDAIAVCQASIAEATAWRECRERQEQPR